MSTGIVVFGHGSSVASANEAVKTVAAEAARTAGWSAYETAFLEADPRLDDAVSRLAARGVDSILVLPYFLTLGIHLQRDLPRLVADLEARHHVPIRVAPPLDGHPQLSRILVDRAFEAAR
ncbi:MAG: CbiX/SirB N-terminal domain-containing protein [Acidobacteriota bacterium]|nr:CbiX/SirB N-terminal domain-containing protein [Acidobacteriota bacterium]